MLAYLDDVKKILELAEKQVVACSATPLPPDVADAIRGPLRACSDAIRQFLLRSTTKHPPKTRLVRVNAALQQVMDPVTWTLSHRKEASKLRRLIQEQIGLVRTAMELHNLRPPSSPAADTAQMKPEFCVVEMGRTPSGNPESIGINLKFSIAGLDLSRRRPSPKPSASSPLVRTSFTSPVSSSPPPGRRAALPAGQAIYSRLSTPKSSLDLSEWPRLSPVRGEEGPAAVTFCSGIAHITAATSETRTHRPSLPRLNQLQQRGSNTSSPTTASPTKRIA